MNNNLITSYYQSTKSKKKRPASSLSAQSTPAQSTYKGETPRGNLDPPKGKRPSPTPSDSGEQSKESPPNSELNPFEEDAQDILGASTSPSSKSPPPPEKSPPPPFSKNLQNIYFSQEGGNDRKYQGGQSQYKQKNSSSSSSQAFRYPLPFIYRIKERFKERWQNNSHK